MKHVKTLLQLIFLGILFLHPKNACAQDLKKDWEGFNPIDWKITVTQQSFYSSYFGIKSPGYIEFTYKTDTTLGVSFTAYLLSDIDTSFNRKLEYTIITQNCIGTSCLGSFSYMNCYYLKAPCDRCMRDSVNFKRCNRLNVEFKKLIGKNYFLWPDNSFLNSKDKVIALDSLKAK